MFKLDGEKWISLGRGRLPTIATTVGRGSLLNSFNH
jgi:hypothetical protein